MIHLVRDHSFFFLFCLTCIFFFYSAFCLLLSAFCLLFLPVSSLSLSLYLVFIFILLFFLIFFLYFFSNFFFIFHWFAVVDVIVLSGYGKLKKVHNWYVDQNHAQLRLIVCP